MIYQDEEECEILEAGGLRIRFTFTLKAGGDHEGPFRRTVTVPAKMGSQAFGAAQSYALKQFYRALFQISTGDKDDVDFHDTGTLAQSRPSGPISAEQLAGLIMLKDESGADTAKMCKAFDVASLAALPVSELARATAMLRQKIKINVRDKIAPNLNGGEHATGVA